MFHSSPAPPFGVAAGAYYWSPAMPDADRVALEELRDAARDLGLVGTAAEIDAELRDAADE